TRETAAERDMRECGEAVGAQIENAWGPGRQAEMAKAFGASPVWAEVQRRLDTEVIQWRAASLAACNVARSPERQRFTRCLEERRKILQSMSDVFRTADPRVSENALNTVMLEVQP